MGNPSIYPTGVTVYDRDRCFNGYTLFKLRGGAALIDMNGNLVKYWKGLDGFPHRLLPGGSILGLSRMRDPRFGYQDAADLIQVDWDGNLEWRFDRGELVRDGAQEPHWILRQHHDYQREGSPAGYYAPGSDPLTEGGSTLILTHTNTRAPQISEHLLIDDRIIEVNWNGEIVWEWLASEHFEEFGLSDAAKQALYHNPYLEDFALSESAGDFIHLNAVSWLGENKWYDAGDERFHPRNMILSSRQANFCCIISRETSRVVWRMGPDFSETPELLAIGQLVGQHHCHMIPRGLPGEGNLLMFDNGGFSGYGAPAADAPDGLFVNRRHYSRVIEVDPVKMSLVWSYPRHRPNTLRGNAGSGGLFSALLSSAQRLPNGNTLIDEGSAARMLEVTPEGEIVWEYLPHEPGKKPDGSFGQGPVYRAYRYPYSYIPQLSMPEEHSVVPPDIYGFRVSGSDDGGNSADCFTELKL